MAKMQGIDLILLANWYPVCKELRATLDFLADKEIVQVLHSEKGLRGNLDHVRQKCIDFYFKERGRSTVYTITTHLKEKEQ